VPTVLEDVPDMAVKFACYEMLRKVHSRLNDGRPAGVAEDLIMGGFAGAAAAAATTPLDVLKTVMMCNASSRPTVMGAAAGIMREGKGLSPFFRGMGPRALSNGLNSAIFFCFFEAIRQVGRGSFLAASSCTGGT
jgi:solute carrier family 25 S-adenosylmethionine transporter 26